MGAGLAVSYYQICLSSPGQAWPVYPVTIKMQAWGPWLLALRVLQPKCFTESSAFLFSEDILQEFSLCPSRGLQGLNSGTQDFKASAFKGQTLCSMPTTV